MLETRPSSCPACHQQREIDHLLQPGILVGTRTDFYERRLSPTPLSYEPIVCAACGFGGVIGWWLEGIELREDQPDEISLRFGFSTKRLTLDERYERCAEVAALIMCNNALQADLWLRASWAAYEAQDPEAEYYYRRKAIQQFAAAYWDFGQLEPEEGPRVAYLVGELNRRCGNHKNAREWFELVSCGPQWLVQLAEQQLHDPREWFEDS